TAGVANIAVPVTTAKAVSATDFAAFMGALGPFETRPHIAIAVSGGPDSMALALLARVWATALDGGATALIVDHGLRPESAREAAQVASWLSHHDLGPKILPWTGPHPRQGLPAAARDARYELLEQYCAAHGILHLLIGHHREDQAETLMMRLGRGSGLDGLAAMASIVERRQIRLLRPLLDVPRARLAATLTRCGQDWVEDPTNHDTAFARARLRAALPALGQDGLTVARLATTARHLGRARRAVEAQCDSLLAAAVALHPAGYLRLRLAPFVAAPEEIGLRVLARCATTISGRAYGPRADRLQRLYEALTEPAAKSRTLAGCRFSFAGEDLMVYRESAAIAGPLPLVQGMSRRWDGRFLVRSSSQIPAGLTIAALGSTGWRQISDRISLKTRQKLPVLARPGLPAIWRRGRVIAVPHLTIEPSGTSGKALNSLEVTFLPIRALSAAHFAIV
ncbi:MAG: tRNA lysidine(34) synthetase TilS, partial [Alphaproteobacteria bacterium]